MTGRYGRHLIFKILLVILVEALAFKLSELVSIYVYPINFTTFTYVVLGSLLAFSTVTIYDEFVIRRKKKIEGEVKALTDVALRRFDVDENDTRK